MRIFAGWRETTEWPWGPAGTARDWVRPGGSLPDADRVADYLDRGQCLVATLSPVGFDDEITGEHVINHPGVRTDGEWQWPTELSHYVRRRAVSPPPDLLARIRAHGYRVPDLTDAQVSVALDDLHSRRPGADRAMPPAMADAFEALVRVLAREGGLLGPVSATDVRAFAADRTPQHAWMLLTMSLGIDGPPPTDEDRACLADFARKSGYDVSNLLG